MLSTLLRGWALGGARGLEEVQQIVAQGEAAGMRGVLPDWLRIAADANRELGRTEDALATLEAALGIEEETGERRDCAELHRLKGEILLQQDARAHADEAERCFRRALEVSRKQEAKSLELRAATSLARLLRAQGRRDEARALLQPVYDWFTEGFDTQDLEDAKALLEELA